MRALCFPLKSNPPIFTLTRQNMELPEAVAADEGSRTGTKGSGLLAEHKKSAQLSDDPGPSKRRPKFSSLDDDGADLLLSRLKSICVPFGEGSLVSVMRRHCFSSPPNRQLTIFYGGQAHVFDDVPPDKANRIVQLAGADSRSWSTTYHTRKASGENSASDGSLTTIEREWERNRQLRKSGSILGANLAFSSDVQNLLRDLSQSGAGRSGQGLPPSEAAVAQSSTETQLSRPTANVISRSTVSHGKELYDNSLPDDNAERAAANIKKDNLERRILLTRSTPRKEGSASRFAGVSGY